MHQGSGEADLEVTLLRKSLDGLPSSILTIDPQGVIVYRNQAAREMVPTLAVGDELRPALGKITHREMIDRLLIRRELTTFPTSPDTPDLHWIVWDKPELEGSLVLTAWDTDWSEVMNARRAAFMMAASHELRGPLTTLRGFSEILNMDTTNLTPEQAEAAAIIETTARHLTVLVEDVFDLSRNSFGELRLNLCDVNLEQVLDSVVPTLRGRIEDRGQLLTCEVETGLPTIKADEARATQMISNLINNASVHNPEGTRIAVRAGRTGDRIAISVNDDGDGLPFEDPDEAFRSFRRGETATAGDRTGSGIGLSITKRLIELHRGEITVESEAGTGTTFTLLFPIEFETALTPGEPGPV